jgi:hypothetical protein
LNLEEHKPVLCPPIKEKVFFCKEKDKDMPVEKAIASSSLVEVLDRVLDKGIVIDAWVRISAVGIEILTIEARVVVASVETYLKYAEAIGLTAASAEPAEAE